MTHDTSLFSPDNAAALEAALDRLADGALDAAERRALFGRLEGTPDGWRKCALALLEVRAWEHALRAPRRDEPPLAVRGAAARQPTRQVVVPRPAQGPNPTGLPAGSGSARIALRWFALAASVLVAFGIGRWERSFEPVAPEPLWPGDQIVQQPPLDDPSARHRVAASPISPSATPADMPRQQRVYRVVFSDPLSGREWEQSVVAEEREDLDYAGLAPTQPVVPPWLQAELQRQGQQVQQRRRLVAYPLEDGRQLVVPVDEVQISPVALPAY